MSREGGNEATNDEQKDILFIVVFIAKNQNEQQKPEYDEREQNPGIGNLDHFLDFASEICDKAIDIVHAVVRGKPE